MSEVRRSGRAVVIDDHGRVLLLHGRTQETATSVAWYTPGGRLEGDETFEQAAIRELAEEVGLVDVVLGPWVWTRYARRRRGVETIATTARFYLARTPSFVPSTINIGGSEADVDWRWWTLDELQGDDQSWFIPARLPELVRALVEDGLPSAPIDVSDSSEVASPQPEVSSGGESVSDALPIGDRTSGSGAGAGAPDRATA